MNAHTTLAEDGFDLASRVLWIEEKGFNPGEWSELVWLAKNVIRKSVTKFDKNMRLRDYPEDGNNSATWRDLRASSCRECNSSQF
jgi:hypothetical protein